MNATFFLHRLRKTPRMFVTCREALLAMVVTALDMGDVTLHVDFYARHLKREGNTLIGGREDFDSCWAHDVIDDALDLLVQHEDNR